MTKKVLLVATVVIIALAVWFYATPLQVVHSQGEMKVQCGQILDREFTENMQEHVYVLAMDPRWSFDVSVAPFGENFQTVIALYGPTNMLIDVTNKDSAEAHGLVSESPAISSGILSARGSYKIRVANTAIGISTDALITNSLYFGGPGSYTLSLGCTTDDGREIRPGELPLSTVTPAPLPTPTIRAALPENPPTFAGIGFPGLAPIDMSNVARVPLPLEAATYGVSPLDNQIYGFFVDAEAGDTLDLSYTRSDGNMNLGLVVLSENNEVFFQASLVTSDSLSTRFTLPEAGQYTIGIFRINLVEPTEAEPTLFQIKGALNSTE